MGRALDTFIVVATMLVALFGLGTGSYISVQLPANTLGPLLVGVSAAGGILGFVKWLRMQNRSQRSRNDHTGVHGPRF